MYIYAYTYDIYVHILLYTILYEFILIFPVQFQDYMIITQPLSGW